MCLKWVEGVLHVRGAHPHSGNGLGAKGAEMAQGAHFVNDKTLSLLLPRQRHQIDNCQLNWTLSTKLYGS
jgi:hypothetical protein